MKLVAPSYTLLFCLSALVAISLSVALPYNSYDDDISQDRQVVVGGKVLCQDCIIPDKENSGMEEEVKPIVGAIVGIVCMDQRGRAVYYSRNATDDYGLFELCLDRYHYQKYGLDGCKVRLLSSPDNACNVKTNMGAGRSGAALYLPYIMDREFVKYIVGPFSFTPESCATFPQSTP